MKPNFGILIVAHENPFKKMKSLNLIHFKRVMYIISFSISFISLQQVHGSHKSFVSLPFTRLHPQVNIIIAGYDGHLVYDELLVKYSQHMNK